ncbi:DCC1-like thiol-disulfide oxidoreductase family protein [Microbulbifer agarilyticus]
MKIFYDGDCPLCSQYTHKLELEELLGPIELVNLRQAPEASEWLKSRGVDPDKGMAVLHFGRLYHGASATRILASMSGASNIFAYLMKFVLSSPVLSAMLYPILRLGRNTLLLVMGRSALAPGKSTHQGWDRILLFIFGFFAFLHLLVYEFQFNAEIYWSTYLIAILGGVLIWAVRQRLVFALLVVIMIADGLAQMPTLSNHTILKNFFLLGVIFAGANSALKGQSWEEFWESVLPVGRCLLVIMYFFGVFHKINQDFLNPDVSCATALWNMMPGWISSVRGPFVDLLFIYGTFAVESALLIMLFAPKWRHLGISVGIVFHMLLALSSYALYAPFSILSIFLHLCFLTPKASAGIVRSKEWKSFEEFLRRPSGVLVACLLFLMVYLSAWAGRYSDVAVISLLIVLPISYLIVRYGRDQNSEAFDHFIPRNRWLVIVPLLFFLNCITPYLGLKTAQSINMFANLRLEDGSNHLLIKEVGPFTYLDDVVFPIDSRGSTKLNYVSVNELGLTYYSLLDELERNRGAKVSFLQRGNLVEDASYDSLAQDAEKLLHPRWFRGWFHFSPVDLKSPKVCALDR